MTKEETMLEKRLIELSKTAYHRDIVTFSDFLNLNELHIQFQRICYHLSMRPSEDMNMQSVR